MNPQIETDEIESMLARSPQLADRGFSNQVLDRLSETNKLKQKLLAGAGLVWVIVVLLGTSASAIWQQVLSFSQLYLSAISAVPELSTSYPPEISLFTLIAIAFASISLVNSSLQR